MDLALSVFERVFETHHLGLTMSHHYFRLHFVVQPGGSRKTEYHVLGSLDEVKVAAHDDLSSADGAYHALFYGEDISLQCWHDGQRLDIIDLHPYITYYLGEGDAPLRFKTSGDAPLFDFYDDEAEALAEQLFEGQVDVRVHIDWERVPLPEMPGTPLPKGQDAVFSEGDVWAYGFHGEWDVYVD